MMKGIENDFAALKHEIATLKKDLTDANQQLSEKDALITSLQTQLAEKDEHKL